MVHQQWHTKEINAFRENWSLGKISLMSLSSSSAMVAATQWFERTLDDSANKPSTIPQAFLAVDAILLIWNNLI